MSRFDFLYRMQLPHRAVSVYIYLSDRANKDGECWPAIPTIATELKLSQSTVRRALRDLRKAGLLQTEQRYRSKGGKSSLLYKLRKGCRKITTSTLRGAVCPFCGRWYLSSCKENASLSPEKVLQQKKYDYI